VLVPLVLSAALAVIGALIVAKVTFVAMRRLGLELTDVLLWFGIAEAPADELALRRAGVQPSFGKSVAGGRTL
jgi:hypothetical protein